MIFHPRLKLFFIILLWKCFALARDLRLCVVKTKTTAKLIEEICPIYDQAGHGPTCVIAVDRMSCARVVVNGIADFTVLEPEDLIIAVETLEYHIMITHEIKWKNDSARTEMVAIMNKDLNDISDVHKGRLCYPGLEASNFNGQDYTSYFEEKLIPRECDPTKTLLENRMASLSHHFDAACIAGAWSNDFSYSTQLKSKFTNLCGLCDNPQGCYSEDKYIGKEGALVCLTENVGDIAWTRLSSARLHFKTEGLKEKDFNYLCPDGTVRSMSLEACPWVKEPWSVVAARADVAEHVSQLITQMMKNNEKLLRLMKNSNTVRPLVALENLETAESYLRKFPGYANAVRPTTCYPPREIQWCTSSYLEYLKCETLKSASLAYNIYPQIFCVQRINRTSCIEAVNKNDADLFVIRPDEEILAKKNGLKPLLHMLTNNRDEMNTIVALVRKESKFKSFKDLKNAKACFTGYQSFGWNAVVAIIRNITNENLDCSDKKVVSDYFGKSCVFGISHENSSFPENLYSLCNETKVVDKVTFDNPDIMTFDCLVNGGEVAFFNFSSASSATRESKFLRTYRLLHTRLLCIHEYDTVDKDCILTWSTLGSIVVNENITQMKEDETREVLLKIDSLFGETFIGRTPLFTLYGSFDKHKNIIFPDETRHLHREVKHVTSKGRSYSDLLDILIKSEKTCISASLKVISNNLIIVLLNSLLLLYFTQVFYI